MDSWLLSVELSGGDSFCKGHVPAHIVLRPGNIVLFQLAGAKDNSGVELGLVISCWRGIKTPKVYAGPVSVNSCPAFRVVALEMPKEDSKWNMGGRTMDKHGKT